MQACLIYPCLRTLRVNVNIILSIVGKWEGKGLVHSVQAPPGPCGSYKKYTVFMRGRVSESSIHVEPCQLKNRVGLLPLAQQDTIVLDGVVAYEIQCRSKWTDDYTSGMLRIVASESVHAKLKLLYTVTVCTVPITLNIYTYKYTEKLARWHD